MKNKKEFTDPEYLDYIYLQNEAMKILAEEVDHEWRQAKSKESDELAAPSPKLNEKLLLAAKSADGQIQKKKKNRIYRKFMRMAAIFVIGVVTASVIGLGTSEAFRDKVFEIFHNTSQDSITLRNNEEYELLGEWSDYWYPTYLPEAFTLTAVDEARKLLMFTKPTGEEVLIYEESNDINISFDSEHQEYEEISVPFGKGYFFRNDDNHTMDCVILTDSRILQIELYDFDNQEEAVKIISSLTYIS